MKTFQESSIQDYIVTEEVRKKEIKKMKYSALIYGGTKDLETEHIQIANGSKIKTFFRHNFELSKYRENLFSRLFHIIVKSTLKLNSVINKSIVESNQVRIEYKSEVNLMANKKDLILSKKNDSLSLNFRKSYYAYKINRKEKKKLLTILDHFSGLDPQIIKNIEFGLIKKSVDFYSVFSMNEEGIHHLNRLSSSKMYDVIDNLCKSRRKGIKGFFDKILKSCERKLKRTYDQYLIEQKVSDYQEKHMNTCRQEFKKYKKRKLFISKKRKLKFMRSCLQIIARKSDQRQKKEIPLWKLSELIKEVHKKTPSKVHYYQLFGLKNVHVFGRFEGEDDGGRVFINNFDEGLFKGTGIVSNYLKSRELSL